MIIGENSLPIIVLVCLLFIIFIKTIFRSKTVCLFRSKLLGVFTRYKIVIMAKFIVKNRTFLQFVIDFILFWLVFIWNRGIIFQAILDFIRPLRNEALTWARNTDLCNMTDWNEWSIIFLYLSPYGRLTIVDSKFLYALNISTVCSAICLILYLIIIHDMDKRHRIWKMAIVGGVSGTVTWYAGYFLCDIITKIPIFYYQFAAVATVISYIVIFFLVIFFWVYFCFLDD